MLQVLQAEYERRVSAMITNGKMFSVGVMNSQNILLVEGEIIKRSQDLPQA